MADLPITSNNGGLPVVINDPTTAANVANVKAGSTASVAGDNALVVTMSPNSVALAVTGGKTNNNAAPGATNVGALTALANAAAPSWTEGDQVLLSEDLSGNVRTLAVPVDGIKPTYSATCFGNMASSPTDVATLYGSATKTIRVIRVFLSLSQTTAGTPAGAPALFKRSSVNTGGTSTVPAIVSHDSADAAATATPRSYTANPTSLGTFVGMFWNSFVFAGAPSTASASTQVELKFGELPGKAIVLRGVAQGIVINFAGITVSGGIYLVTFEWTEE